MVTPAPKNGPIYQQLVEISEIPIEDEMNAELKEIEKEMKLIRELTKDQAHLVLVQQPVLNEIEARTQSAFQNAGVGVVQLKKAEELKVDQNRFKFYAGGGAALGFTLGAVGFAINPFFGAATMLLGSGIGAGVGSFLGLTAKK